MEFFPARGTRFPAQSLVRHMELLGHTETDFHNSRAPRSPSSSSLFPLSSSTSPSPSRRNINRYLDVLKVDIESSEYRAFQGMAVGECPAADVRVGQLLIELHAPQNQKSPGSTVKRFFHHIYSCGMLLFSKERNHWGCSGFYCVEFSFVSPSVAFADFKRVNPVCQ